MFPKTLFSSGNTQSYSLLPPWSADLTAPVTPAVQTLPSTPVRKRKVTHSTQTVQTATHHTQTPPEDLPSHPKRIRVKDKKVRFADEQETKPVSSPEVTESPKAPVKPGFKIGKKRTYTRVRLEPFQPSTTPVITPQSKAIGINTGEFEQQLHKLICEDTGTFSLTAYQLKCGHSIAQPPFSWTQPSKGKGRKKTPLDSISCPHQDCGESSSKSQARKGTLNKQIRAQVREVFNPRPQPGSLSSGEADVLFEEVCKRIDSFLRPRQSGSCSTNRRIAEEQIHRATKSVSSYLEWWNKGQPTVTPPSQASTSAPISSSRKTTASALHPRGMTRRVKRKARIYMKCPYAINTTIRSHSLGLPGPYSKSGRLVLTHNVPRDQTYFHTGMATRFVEYLPDIPKGQALATELEDATQKGVRFLATPDPDKPDTRKLSWNPAIPVHDDKDREYPVDGLRKLEAALDKILYE
ncbi:hypothetical protein [Parendozoicomonas haliclonae]|uniref:Uncharacterized protein n=1 Tax=Parendozoicomonas haliclonae TaxID=1960125 RepID=A0A1X7AGY4_9GAMM|nr:hypothetical protein [Parendozoicomonas haliclonae]SMA39353.1 hypothetical protein EHSB41UT_01019 [Parendozoicomonas haliclonae]